MSLSSAIATGAFMNKEHIGDKLRWFSSVLAMIALVHERGTMKYTSYSWMADPEKSNSSISDNLDAIERHLGAHTMGRLLDPEGLPHIFHAACRAGMLVTTFLRKKYSVKSIPVRDKTASYSSFASALIGSQITTEEIIALTKTLPESLSNIKQMQPSELLPIIRGLLIDLHLDIKEADSLPSNKNLFENMSKIEILFQLICYYTRACWIFNHQLYCDLLQEVHSKKPYREEDCNTLSLFLDVTFDEMIDK